MNDLELYEQSRHTDSGIRFIGIDMKNDFALHWHEHLEFHFIIRGEADVRCGSRIVHFKENECLIINSNELHEGIPKGSYECFEFKLHPAFFDNKHYLFEHLVKDDNVSTLMFKIIELYERQDDASVFLVKGYIFQLISYLLEHYAIKDISENVARQNIEKLEKMNTVASFMHNNYGSEITTESLAEMCHYNYSHFCHTFKEVFGMSANKYLLTIRINIASTLLLTTDMTITEIASVSGFADSNYFARVFKKETGLSPSGYRLNKEKIELFD